MGGHSGDSLSEIAWDTFTDYRMWSSVIVGGVLDRETNGQGTKILGTVAIAHYLSTPEGIEKFTDTLMVTGVFDLIAKTVSGDPNAVFIPDSEEGMFYRELTLSVLFAIAAGEQHLGSDILYSYLTSVAFSMALDDFTRGAADELLENHPNLWAFVFDTLNDLVYGSPSAIDPRVKIAFDRAYTSVSPLILDLDGDGIETVGADDSTAMFDLDDDGRKNIVGWVKPDDGLLVFDRNGDGIINNGNELFGNHTLKYDGSGKCKNGFEALAQEDTNKDGVVNHLDANWGNLRIWRDLNQDGITDAGELFTLEELGIHGLNVSYDPTHETLKNGNVLYGNGSWVDSSGETHKMTDSWLKVDNFNREFETAIDIPDEMKDLPNMQGSGALRDLLESAVGSSELKNLLTQFNQAATREEQVALIEDLLYSWAKTSGMIIDMAQRCSGSGLNLFQSGTPDNDVDAWNKKLFTLEAFNGQYFFRLPGDKYESWESLHNSVQKVGGSYFGSAQPAPSRQPGAKKTAYIYSLSQSINFDRPSILINWQLNQVKELENAYNVLLQNVYNALVPQTTRLDYIWDKLETIIDIDSGKFFLNYKEIIEYFTDQLVSEEKISAFGDFVDFTKGLSSIAKNNAAASVCYELIGKTIDSWGYDQAMLELYSSLNLNISGLSNYTPDGTIYDDVIFGSAANDSINGGNGDDILYGGAGNDELRGGDGDEILDGGAGNDKLYGGAGDNTYIIRRSEGQDLINNYGGGNDLLKLIDIDPAELWFKRSGYNLEINMDAENNPACGLIASKANLLGAIRLPNTALNYVPYVCYSCVVKSLCHHKYCLNNNIDTIFWSLYS